MTALSYRTPRLLINGHVVVRRFPGLFVTDDRIVWEEVARNVVVCAAVPSADVDLEDIGQVRGEVEAYRPRRVENHVPVEVEQRLFRGENLQWWCL